jgi:hypothetical protein
MTPCTDIRTYTRDAKGTPTGIIIATKSTRPDMKYAIGWAKCNTKVDTFNKPMALKIAIGRLKAAEDEGKPFLTAGMPHEVRRLIDRFNDRCTRYFK